MGSKYSDKHTVTLVKNEYILRGLWLLLLCFLFLFSHSDDQRSSKETFNNAHFAYVLEGFAAICV